MPCTVVVGGQFGSEGKGKTVALLARRATRPWVVRCGGPNSGHTVDLGGNPIVLRHVPTGVINAEAVLLLSAGCAIDEDVLIREIAQLRLPRERVIVDPRAVLVTERHRLAEKELRGRISSTASGTGAALAERLMRAPGVGLASHSVRLARLARVEAVAPLLHEQLADGGMVIVEGSQGFGLSLLHGTNYPHVTSRDTTASGFAAEVGLSPRHVDRVVLVVRTWPIRVGGPSGPLDNEVSWDEIRVESGAPETVPEFTSVTGRLRRVARFDMGLVRAACEYNLPTSLSIMGLDRLQYSNRGARTFDQLGDATRAFLDRLTSSTGVPIELAGTGFRTEDAFTAFRTHCPASCNERL